MVLQVEQWQLSLFASLTVFLLSISEITGFAVRPHVLPTSRPSKNVNHPRRSTLLLPLKQLQSSRNGNDDDASNDKMNNPAFSTGEIGAGPNWLERSFPVETKDGAAAVDPKSVDDYNLGLSGTAFGIGSLSKRMFDTMVERSSLDVENPEIRQALKVYAMDFSAKEAVRAALLQNGLEMVLADEEQDEGMWGDVDSIRLAPSNNDNADDASGAVVLYDSWQDAVDHWEPGQSFDFCVRQVPAKMRELTLRELLDALDPNGELKAQAAEAGMSLPDQDATTLTDLANENVRRTESAPYGATADQDVFAGTAARAYQPMHASALLEEAAQQEQSQSNDDDSPYKPSSTVMHAMDAMVSHGCVIIDLTNGGTNLQAAKTMAALWQATETFFALAPETRAALPPMQTAAETGSVHAKVGYSTAAGGDMEFLETRWTRDGTLLPAQVADELGTTHVDALRDAMTLITDTGKALTRLAVATSSVEAGALLPAPAWQSASRLVHELVDDGRKLSEATSEMQNENEGTVNMSPHRLCSYSNQHQQEQAQKRSKDDKEKEEATTTTREVFGAHTDSSFVTAVPVAAVSGLEVYDEAAEVWFRPELAAYKAWEAYKEEKGLQADEEIVDGVTIPWYARYLVLVPGELLQLATRDEVLATVHRVVATADRPSRLSAPVLLRVRPGMTWDVDRYLGGAFGSKILEQVSGMTVEEIHDAMQPSSFQ